MIKKTTRSPVFSALLSAVMVLAMCMAFSLYAEKVLADNEIEIESGSVTCNTIPPGCGSFGCNGNPPNYSCSLYANQPGASCTSGGGCGVH